MSVKVLKSASQYINSLGGGHGVYFMSTMGIVTVEKGYTIKDGQNVTHFERGELSHSDGFIYLHTNVGNFRWRLRNA